MRDNTINRRAFMFITNKCGHTCSYCFMGDHVHKTDMSLQQFADCCKILRRNSYDKLTILGGEPLLHPKIIDFAKCAIEFGFGCSISTSGVNHNQRVFDELLQLPLDDVTISVDSHQRSNHDFMRGAGSFDKAVEASKLCVKYNIPFRCTATISQKNVDDIYELAVFVKNLGAFQLDLHVMSLMGRASGLAMFDLSAPRWYEERKKLDKLTFADPFHISYPIMWYLDDEYSNFENYCDARTCNRVSTMPDVSSYFCTLTIDDPFYSWSILDAVSDKSSYVSSKFDFSCIANMCPIEKKLGTQPDKYKYLCRFYKKRTSFSDELL